MRRKVTRVRIHSYDVPYTQFIFNHTYRIGGYRRATDLHSWYNK